MPQRAERIVISPAEQYRLPFATRHRLTGTLLDRETSCSFAVALRLALN
jgi:hypothetical protein